MMRGLALFALLFLTGCTAVVQNIPPDVVDLIEGAKAFVDNSLDTRSYDGQGNNPQFFTLGAAGTTQLRFSINDYSDGIGSPSQINRAADAPRWVSNTVHDNNGLDRKNSKNLSDIFWLWGQFIDHDMDHTPQDPGKEAFDIGVPAGDPFFDPLNTGTKTIDFVRSGFQMIQGVRHQLNSITAFLDASNVYGSDESRATALRANGGTSAYLKTSSGGFLPFNVDGLMNDPADDPHVDPTKLFLAGDVRANENVALSAMHTLFMREHNYLVDRLRDYYPSLDEETVYQIARAIVGAEIQAITYREFLPYLLGQDALPLYQGYRNGVNPQIHIFFSTVAFRFGHSMVSPKILRRARGGVPIPQGDLELKDAFFRDVPNRLLETGLEPLFIGLQTQKAQGLDPFVIGDLRNLLFGAPGNGGLDLAALNIQRARDHGLPQLNEARRRLGLLPHSNIDAINSESIVRTRLQTAYSGDVESVDAWTGGLSEAPVSGAMVGQTFFVAIRDQFLRLRDGDRFWYQQYLPPALVRWVEKSTLAEIVRRNTQLFDEVSDNLFEVR